MNTDKTVNQLTRNTDRPVIDERTEQLINRRLDGELTEPESLELDKRLIRSPQARTRLEEYERTDARAAAALRAALEDHGSAADRAEQLAGAAVRRRRWSAVPGAIAVAAVVAAAVLIGGQAGNWLTPRPPVAPTPVGIDPEPTAADTKAGPIEHGGPLVVMEGPRRDEQPVVRDIFGVFDEETQSLYLLEASRTQTNAVPASVNY